MMYNNLIDHNRRVNAFLRLFRYVVIALILGDKV